MKQLFVLFSFLLLIALSGCFYDRYDELHPVTSSCDTSSTMSYSTHIVPILSNSCGINNSCHASSNTSGYDLSTYTGVAQIANSGQLVSCIIWDGNASQMPQGSTSQISICAQTQIQKWVAAGYPNN